MQTIKAPINKVVVASRLQAIELVISNDSKVIQENWNEIFQWYREVTATVESFDKVITDIQNSVKKGRRTSEQADKLINKLINKEVQLPLPDNAPFNFDEMFPEVPRREKAPSIKQIDILTRLGLLEVEKTTEYSVTEDTLWDMLDDEDDEA